MRFTDSPYEDMMRQKPTGRRAAAQAPPVLPPGHRCHNCPYGRDAPCLGVCLQQLMRKEEDKCSL